VFDAWRFLECCGLAICLACKGFVTGIYLYEHAKVPIVALRTRISCVVLESTGSSSEAVELTADACTHFPQSENE
jgi:hypothetical protein